MDTELPPVWVPTTESEKYRRIAENNRMRNARYNKKRPDRSHGKIPLAERPFIVWDGEGPKDTGYSLLGNSEGEELCSPFLGTVDCLELLLSSAEAHPQSIHISFGFNYDVSNILRELSWKHLTALRKFNRTVWREYSLEHIPHKWFKVKRGHTTIKVFDVLGFFQTGLVEALESWKIGPFTIAAQPAPDDHTVTQSVSIPSVTSLAEMSEAEIVRQFKKLRSEFTWANIGSIRIYMNLELKYTKIMMEMLRQAFLDAGYLPRSWHGPAALAREAFKKHNVYAALTPCPPDVQIAARYAFFGGRFEQFLAGHVNQKVYVADLNSAYPYYCSQLPNLARGTWRRGREFESGKFAIYYIDYCSRPPDSFKAYPLPHRDSNLNVIFPHRTSGWYWAPEAELVANDRDGIFREAWIFDEVDTSDRPFAWITEYYRRRQLLKRVGNPAQLTFKLVINSVFGILAQRAGWNRKTKRPPGTHQLEYAGYITSGCRAAVYNCARVLGRNLVSIDTDGVTSLVPFSLESSDELGGWEIKTYDDGIFWQSGIYCLRKGDDWPSNKTRGIARGAYKPAELTECLRTGTSLKLTRRVFYGYGLALQTDRALLNQWRDEPAEYEFGGHGKRLHFTPHGQCTSVCDGDIHRLALPGWSVGAVRPCDSKPHMLPWLAWSDQKSIMDDITMYEEEEWNEEQRWVMA